MGSMGNHSATESTPPRKDHLWVLVIIATCALLEVWASWIAIGSMSGFPKIGGAHGMPTDWTLAVTTEAYWGYALYSWLAAAPGPRSRGFAMWSAVAVFLLSLTGQGAAHLVKPGTAPPAALVVFVTALPVLVLALIAILVHLRQADRDAAAAVREQAAADDDRAILRGQLAGAQEALAAERAARETAEQGAAGRTAAETERDEAVAAAVAAETARSEAERQAAESAAKVEALTRKLTRAAGPAGRTANAAAGRGNRAPAVPKDFDAQAEALSVLAAEPDISGAKLAERVGRSERWGQDFKKNLAARGANGPETAP